MESNIKIENANPVSIFGINDVNIEKIRTYFPKLKIIARGSNIKIFGDKAEIERFQSKIKLIIDFINKHNSIKENDLDNILSQEDANIRKEIQQANNDVIAFATTGKPIKAKTPNQHKIVKEYENNDLLFAIGPAGTGKTYIAIALAVRALKNKQVKRIILSRPAVEAGEKLGFLPGDLKDKLDPYLQALYDALFDMISAKN